MSLSVIGGLLIPAQMVLVRWAWGDEKRERIAAVLGLGSWTLLTGAMISTIFLGDLVPTILCTSVLLVLLLLTSLLVTFIVLAIQGIVFLIRWIVRWIRMFLTFPRMLPPARVAPLVAVPFDECPTERIVRLGEPPLLPS